MREMEGKNRDLKGQRFGRLTVLEPTKERRNGYTVWKCRCDCGAEIFVSSRHLKNGWTNDCGCQPKMRKRKDLTGLRLGLLTVEAQLPGGGSCGSRWRCRCDCGGMVETSSGQLLSGNRKSCGCLSRPPLKDWVGRHFGELEVISYDGKRGGKHYWRCRCSCGNESVVSQSNLKSGHTTSCGCKVDPASTRHFVEGTCIESLKSRKAYTTNRSGIRGVYQNSRTGQWVAQITFQGKTHYLGSYLCIEEAALARAKGEAVFEEFLEKYGETGAGMN